MTSIARFRWCLRLSSALAAAAVLALAPATGQPAGNRVKNIILMEADGSGISSIEATGMYSGKIGKRIFDRPEWAKSWVSTYPLRTGDHPIAGAEGLRQDRDAIYDPAKNWDTRPATTSFHDYPDRFAGYAWTKRSAPDSANTMSAVVNGYKSYNNAINVDGNGRPVTTIAELAARAGKSVGAVTTVEVSDATPAAGAGTHNASRLNHADIFHEMLTAGVASVIMGAGNPDYGNDGARRPVPSYDWIGAADWMALKAGKQPNRFALIEDKRAFDALPDAANPPRKLAGIVTAFNSTQYNRPGASPASETPFSVPRRSDVPSLPTMVKGALHILDRNASGMFLVIEGGAVDRAEHGNNIGRMIEERMEYEDAVGAVAAYLDANTNGNNWSNTLVILSADHDHLLLGPDSDTVPYQPLTDNGPGHVPGYKWQNNSHSNQLVPLYARGPGAETLMACATRNDAYRDEQGREFGRGRYLDQTDIFRVMAETLKGPVRAACPAG